MSGLSVRNYDPSQQAQWDAFVRHSKNGTFLFERDYMDYHRDRFADCSLLIIRNAEILAVLPAHRSDCEVHSHDGLTYGGFVTSAAMTTPAMIDAFAAVIDHLRKSGCRTLYYKTVPMIYHQIPAEEDRYALFQLNAELYRRDVLSVLRMKSRTGLQSRRRRGAGKSSRHGVVISRSDDWAGYWALLSGLLENRFGVAPVHTLEEIDRLRQAFPDNIALHLANLAGELIAGVVIYESARVAHVQYIATSPRGRELGALDQLFAHLLDETYAAKDFFDFGKSSEGDGWTLNRGLIEQKEGFGARAVVHDFYRLRIAPGGPAM
jgi:hypothetical protein